MKSEKGQQTNGTGAVNLTKMTKEEQKNNISKFGKPPKKTLLLCCLYT